MKKFEIYMNNEDNALTVLGEIITVADTGQSVIYSKNDPTYANIVAIIPKSAVVIVSPITN